MPQYGVWGVNRRYPPMGTGVIWAPGVRERASPTLPYTGLTELPLY